MTVLLCISGAAALGLLGYLVTILLRGEECE